MSMTVRDLIEELKKYRPDTPVELSEEGSMELSAETINLDIYPTGHTILWLGLKRLEEAEPCL